MVLVAPGICRFVVHGEIQGEATANILDMQVDTTGGTAARDEALFDIAGDILNNFDDHIRIWLVDDWVAQRVSWVDLDTSSGPVGERSSTSATTWPAAGGLTDAPMPANVAWLVKKQIVGTRGRRSGRMYLPGVSEALTATGDGNRIDPASLTGFNGDLATFLGGINDAEGPTIGVQRQLVVVHTQQPDPAVEPSYNGYTPVESLVADALLATQRRRLR